MIRKSAIANESDPIARRQEPAIIISPYQHLPEVFKQNDIEYVVSILGESDKLSWPEVGARKVLRLRFDDTIISNSRFIAPSREQIAELIDFGRKWSGTGTIVAHCRAGSSRSVGAGLILAAALGRSDTKSLVLRVRTAKKYFRPNETMLKLADSLLMNGPGLTELSRSIPTPTESDPWGPVRVELRETEGHS